jgi:Copper chaperone
MNEELKFKTNINCEKCIARVKPFIDKVDGIESWNVDTDNPDKILTVKSNGATSEQIIDAIENVGFDIEKI